VTKPRRTLAAGTTVHALREEAKALLYQWQASDEGAERRVIASLPRTRLARSVPVSLLDTRQVIAHELGFANWSALKREVEGGAPDDPVTRFTIAALAPLDGSSHPTGTLVDAEALREQHPDVIGSDLVTASLLGLPGIVRALVVANPDRATAPAGLHDWDPLTYLCFSRYLRLDPVRGEGFVETARILLDHGASANTGFYSEEHEPEPTIESVLYGAAGVARQVELTRLLLERGADPNDGETPYHVPEGWDNAVLEVLLESKKVDPNGLATILARKHDWHDRAGIALALRAGADPDRVTAWGRTAIEHAILRDNGWPLVELLLDHGAARAEETRRRSVEAAARAGRKDLLEHFAGRGMDIPREGEVGLLVACARDDGDAASRIAARDRAALATLVDDAGRVLLEFAGIGNTGGLRRLIALGFDPTTIVPADPYLDVPGGSTPLHVAAWCARHDAVKLLVSPEWRERHGVVIDAKDARGETPLSRAVNCAVDSHWTERRSVESIRVLLDAGADPEAVLRFPSGDDAIDEELCRHGR
jgi:ankyrin repeat protein